MSRRRTVSVALVAAALAAGAFAAGRAFSEDPPAGGPMPPEVVEMLKEMEKLKATGPQHAELKLFTGEWTGKGTWTEQGMTAPFTEDLVGKMVYGDRFLHVDSVMTSPMGKMASTMYIGFDNAKQKYVQTMLGDWSTQIGASEGTYDAATKTFTMDGVETLASGKTRKYRMQQKVVSNDEWTLEMWFEPRGGGEMQKAGTATYTRKK
jgi:hypothetical protein